MSSAPRAVRKAVIPAAGLGTRFLPVTKASPKEMLPVVDKPVIEYVVEEAARAGLDDVLLITGRSKRAIEDHFDRSWELEAVLEAKGDKERLAVVRHSAEIATVHSVRQGEPKGLGHAVLCAAGHVGNESFAVLLGDDMIDERDELLSTMIQVQRDRGGSVIALIEVPRESISMYGCVAIAPTDTQDVVRITDMVEKPSVDEAPSNYAIIGRYLLAPEIFAVLRQTPPGRGGEIQLTDALKVLAGRDDEGGPVHGVLFRGRRYDTGDRLDYLRTVVQLASERDDLGPPFRAFLRDFVHTFDAGGDAGGHAGQTADAGHAAGAGSA